MQKIIFMTGATSGLGKVAACNIAAKGATLIAASRNPEKGEALLTYYKEQYPQGRGRIELVDCKLNSFESIAMACKEISESYKHLDMIINNAGIMNFEYKETQDGIEETWQVNLLAPILITHLLGDLLKASPEPKLIYTTSGLHQGTINFDNLEFKDSFSSYKTYRQSKLGIILLTRYLAKQLAEKQIGVYCQHPGMVNTGLSRSAGWMSKLIFKWMGKTPEQGAETLEYLIETDSEELISGEYYTNCQVAKITKESYDMDMAKKLLDMVKGYLRDYITEKSLVFP